MGTPPKWALQPKNYHPSPTNNNAANSSRTAVKFEIQPILNLTNAFVHRKRAYGRDRHGKCGYTGQTRCIRLWYAPNHVVTPVGRPAEKNYYVFVPIEVITYSRKPARRMNPCTRCPWPWTDVRIDSYIRKPDPPGWWFDCWYRETLVRRVFTMESIRQNFSNSPYECCSYQRGYH